MLRFLDGGLIFLSGSPELQRKAGIKTGRLSGLLTITFRSIYVPIKSQVMPRNCIEDWEESWRRSSMKTLHSNMTLISGIPPWATNVF
jgi:hypothetical protein